MILKDDLFTLATTSWEAFVCSLFSIFDWPSAYDSVW